jgi:ethanolamine ammonia-lyase small subunit
MDDAPPEGPTEAPSTLPSTSAPGVTPARWGALRRFTDARIALGRAGHSQPTAAHLAFQLAHAQARDAVHLPLDAVGVAQAMVAQGLEVMRLHSAAGDRSTYLQRPDLGRRLDERSRQELAQWRAARETRGETPGFDLAFVVADGLSALAVHHHAAALLAALMARLRADVAPGWTVAPVVVVEQGRVAIGDEIGAALKTSTVVVLIGERPGLSSPDSLGVYFTWAPQVGLSDAARNCISNVRPAGLAIEGAAARLHGLLTLARTRQLSGVALKDESDDSPALAGAAARPSVNFLLPSGL